MNRPVNALARTHLANERTFLAWVRTSVTVLALGLGAAQLLDDQELLGVPANKLLAATMILLGLAITVVGRLRYRQAAMGIIAGEYRTHRRVLDVVVVGIVAVALLALLFVVQLR